MNAGNRLRASRIRLGLSQKDLANLLGMKTWISTWERGHHHPPPYLWRALEKLEDEKKRTQRSGRYKRSRG
jgi:transcriptional regulator with XRE-family HTH domain